MQKSRTIELSDYRNAPLNFQAFLLYDFDMFFVGSYSSRVIFVPHRVGTMRKHKSQMTKGRLDYLCHDKCLSKVKKNRPKTVS